MSMIYCHTHDRHVDTDYLEGCPDCIQEEVDREGGSIKSTTHHKGLAAIDGTGLALWEGYWAWGYRAEHPSHGFEPYWHIMGQSKDYASALKRAADLAESEGAFNTALFKVEKEES